MSVVKEIRDMKLPAEANIVSCLFKRPDLFYEYSNLKYEDFHFNEWRVFWTIGNDLVLKENKPVLDELTIGFYLEKHPKLKEKYEEYGGYATIESAKKYIEVENLDGYVAELHKWNTVLKLYERKFPIKDRIKDFTDMGLEEIYNIYEANLNDIFVNVESKVKSYNLCEGMFELIEEADKGLDVGLPIQSKILNETIGGNVLGNITLLGGLSGAGKTTLTLELLLPSILEKNEQCVLVINEQDEKKIRQEMLTWYINNILNKRFNKVRFRQGKFTEDEMSWLRQSAEWFSNKIDNKNITIIPLSTYSVDVMKKIINKYSAMGCNYFILDTFKHGDNVDINNVWFEMMNDMRKLYDNVKPINKNVHLWATLQLKKDKISSRYLTTDNIGMSKNIVDVCSTTLLMRGVRDDEKSGGKSELQVYRLEGKNGRTKIPVTLDANKNYALIFIDKNRFGSSKEFQIVAESDLGRNVYREIGVTKVVEDY